ncbi:EF hand [Planctomycetes bacterium CA13]|uniref:EF hand n=1 Tax=Novipirellula herctigrandis TaxID=2527986 RepID=A0A5C5ZB09_9BACT|nr:EF hand [Planctomycetes bacterium CA13]
MITRISMLLVLLTMMYGPGQNSFAKEGDAFQGRYDVFSSFHIKGAGGTDFMELAAKYGANTIRTWRISDDTGQWLEDADKLNQKLILGIWMPHQGRNGIEGKTAYDFDYRKRREEMLKKLDSHLDAYDDHSALLMWGLGNEVHLEEQYLTTVNEMAKRIHRRNPHRLTCIVIINAPKKSIDLIKQHAPEVDMIGVNAYSKGAMQTAINNLEKHWKKPYYFSEYSHRGPWAAKKGATDHALELTPFAKVQQLREANPMIKVGKNNTGGVVFVWGEHKRGMGTWFSLLLPEDPRELLREKDSPLVTPMADEMHRFWTGKEPSNRAPVIERLTLGGTDQGIEVSEHEKLKVVVTANDPDNDLLTYRYLIFRARGNDKGKLVWGPVKGTSQTKVEVPPAPGDYRLYCQVLDGRGKGTVHHVPFRIVGSTDSDGTRGAPDDKKSIQTEAIFQKRDKDKDERLTLKEFIANAYGEQKAGAERRFTWSDKDQDGHVTLDEFKATWGKVLRK